MFNPFSSCILIFQFPGCLQACQFFQNADLPQKDPVMPTSAEPSVQLVGNLATWPRPSDRSTNSKREKERLVYAVIQKQSSGRWRQIIQVSTQSIAASFSLSLSFPSPKQKKKKKRLLPIFSPFNWEWMITWPPIAGLYITNRFIIAGPVSLSLSLKANQGNNKCRRDFTLTIPFTRNQFFLKKSWYISE